MTLDMAQAIKDIAKSRGIKVCIINEYSGRETYGDTTTAISSELDLFDLAMEIALEVISDCEYEGKVNERIRKGREIIEFLQDYAEVDSLGLDYVIY